MGECKVESDVKGKIKLFEDTNFKDNGLMFNIKVKPLEEGTILYI